MTEYTDVYSNTLQYDYDEAGNITAETTLQPPGATVMTYGADNRLATCNGQPVTYDDDGNMTQGPLAGDMVNFTFDSRSRLTGAGDTSYTYDANNNRVSVSDSVYQTSYTVNPNALLSQVLTATDESDNKTYYVYGLGLIGQEETGGSYRTYHYDLRGSTVALTDENGDVTDRFQYAPYGELVYRTGNTDTPFLFSGKYGVMTDASGLYYMRARYYNPMVKRFLSPDIIMGSITNPKSQNLYIYCQGNPVNYTDPTGHWEKGDEYLTLELQQQISYLTDAWLHAETQEQRDAIHNQANAIRDEFASLPVAPPSVDVNTNIVVASDISHNDFYNNVKNGGIWDYKQFGSLFEDFGNFNFGATGAANGFSEGVLLREAGWAQGKAGTSSKEWGKWYADPPYGDDPHDQLMIQKGIYYYNRNYTYKTCDNC